MTLRHLTKVVSLVLAMSVMALFSLWAQEQDADSAAAEEYRSQYTAVQKCAALTKPKPLQKCVLDYLAEAGREHTDLFNWAVGEYVRAMTKQIQQSRHEELIVAGEAMLKWRPDEMNLITQLCYSAFHSGQYAKAIGYCETVYEQNPAPNLFQILLSSYKETGDQAKYVDYSSQAIDVLEPTQAFPYLEELLAAAAQREDWAEAARYARKILDLLSKMERNPSVSEQEWDQWVGKKRAQAHLLLGRDAYEGQDWPSAVVAYQRVIRYSGDKDLRGESYYYIGLSNWKENRLTPAMQAFACGAAQKGSPHAGACDGYLTRLYKSGHNGSTAGIEEFKARANGDCS